MRFKKTIALMLSLAMIVSMFSGCGNKTGSVEQLESVAENNIVLSDTIVKEESESAKEYEDYFTDDVQLKTGVNIISGGSSEAEEETDDDIITSIIEANKDKKEESEDVDIEKIPFDLAYPDVFNSEEVSFADNAILLKLKDTYSEKTAEGLKKSGVGKMETLFEVEDYVWYTAYLLKDVDVKEAMAQVREVSGVVTAEYNYKYEAASEVEEVVEVDLSANPNFGQQWPVDKIGIKEAWNHLQKETSAAGGSSNVVVAVIDTGVDYNHIDLKANMWTNVNEVPDNGVDDDGNGYVDDYYGIDMTAGQGSGMDDHGHGTHVAGIVAASNNKEGIVGYAYNTKIMAIKAGDASGYFLNNNVASAILYAYDHGADVINMSFGGSSYTTVVQDALAVAYSRCVLVASAGNDNKPNENAVALYGVPNYPAAFSYVIGVMSVDQMMKESSFSNWDYKLYNNAEYEVYAPGEQIISTLPGDRYGVLSGTSMAAPVVAAQAALIRSCYSDTELYPTKFIYGQIVGTADACVTCFDADIHGKHNIPGVVNYYSSLTYLPTPDVGMSDFTIFDTAGFVADSEGLTDGCEDVNNGDGIVDAGETLAIGFTLKNRWGMSENTMVHIDATSDLGGTNPYVTFLNNDINYKSIGTYSENDCGKLFSEDGEYWTGWENPFYVKISKDCPNDYSITLYLTITCGNALNPGDDYVYTTEEAITFTVRRGQILPNRVEEDITLTKDNYYIIPNSMLIVEGATLTIEEGAKVQFWCSEETDSYADTAIAYLNVAGNLICKGTEEEPIEMFPSGWMDSYHVEIYTSGNGYASLEYTNVTNPYITVNDVKNCEFTQNYKDSLNFRKLESGIIREYGHAAMVAAKTVSGSAFYKLGSYSSYQPFNIPYGAYEKCIFVDSFIDFKNMTSAIGCVFYGNNNQWVDGNGNASIWEMKYMDPTNSVRHIFRNNETGSTYILFKRDVYDDISQRFAKTMGGHLTLFNDIEETKYVFEKLYDHALNGVEQYAYMSTGLYEKDGVVYNWDGTEFPWDSEWLTKSSTSFLYPVSSSRVYLYFANYVQPPLMEIPGDIYITDIELNDYVVDLDLASTHQIKAKVTPSTADSTSLVYESMDKNVVTVDEKGLVTPIGTGSTTVRVYAPDYAVYNYVTVNVVEAVELESLAIREGNFEMNVDTSVQLHVDYTPTYTTKRNVTFNSSNTEVATVDEAGVLTALTEGETTITVVGDKGIEASIVVKVVIPVESLAFAEDVYATNIEQEDGTAFYPVITPSNATYQDLIWETSNPEVAYVDEDGNLVKLQEGTATLRATLKDNDFMDTIVVAVTNGNVSLDIKSIKTKGNYIWALTEEGTLWYWGNDVKYPTVIMENNVEDFMHSSNSSYVYILDKSGVLKKYNFNGSNLIEQSDFTQLTNIKALTEQFYAGTSYFAISDDGYAWAWGSNSYGQLGIGTNTYTDIPTVVDLEGDISKIISVDTCTLFLTQDELYMAGGYSQLYSTPKLLYSDVMDISAADTTFFEVYKQDEILYVYKSSLEEQVIKKNTESLRVGVHIYYIEDGQLYLKDHQSGYDYENIGDFVEFSGVKNVEKVFDVGSNIYVQTTDDKLYAFGYGSNNRLGTGSAENAGADASQRVFLGLVENDVALALESWNGVLDSEELYYVSDDKIVLDYNAALDKGTTYSSIVMKDSTDVIVAMSKTMDLDKLTITPKVEMTDGMIYTITVPANALTERGGSYNEAIELTFTYKKPVVEDDEIVEDEVTEDEVVEDEVVVEEIHETVVDEDKYAERHFWTNDEVQDYWDDFVKGGHYTRYHSNAIINRVNDDNVKSWLRITTPSKSSTSILPIGMGGNYWGTTNMDLINEQILDFDDYQSLYDIVEGDILMEAPEDTFPFVVDAYLEVEEEKVDVVGNDLVTFVVEFNRDMDTSIPLEVNFGSAYPYADYQVSGEYATPRQWRGEMQLTTIIENGYQYWSVSNGKAAGTSMKLYTDWGRFPFKIDTSSAQALIMQAEVTAAGINLTWTQDDYDTLAGYNVYRSTSEDGFYTKLNRTVIPADTMEWFDDTVEPGQKYYYNFTVVETDLSESEPSGKVQVTAMDTMAPDIYHSPVYHAFTGSNLIISATVTDNVNISSATLYYRITGTDSWNSKTMTNNNDKYSAVIPADMVTVAGLEYYIDATDGISHTYEGTAEEPFSVTVQVAVADSAKGDVDGNGKVELKDALMLLMAINDRLNLNEEEFARADLDGSGELAAKEALRIMQYVNGSVTSVLP